MNEGMKKGLLFAMILIVIHIMILLFNNGSPSADLLLWFFQLICYFLAGSLAAESFASHSIDLDGVNPDFIVSSSRSATLIMCFVLWMFIILRSVILDDGGLFSHFGVIGSLGFGVVDFICALAIGGFVGVKIKNNHSSTNNF